MSGVKVGGVFIATCYDKYGQQKWSDTFGNLVVSTGLQYVLDAALTAGTQVSTWHIGLLGPTSTISTGDRLSTHGFTESTDYSDATRREFEEARSGVSVTNSANKSTFNLNKDGTSYGGAMLCSSNAKGGTTGILLCAAAFSGGNKSGDSGDKLEVTYTFSAADDGV